MNGWKGDCTRHILTRFVVLPQLARIQTDSVAEKLKELYPDISLEIGESAPVTFSVFNLQWQL